jgi:hypothetical protein
MKETEWLRCTDPELMLRFLRSDISQRKLRLYACACCRRVRPYFSDRRGWQAVEVAERYADRAATKRELVRAFRAAHAAALSLATPQPAAFGSAPYAGAYAAENSAEAAALSAPGMAAVVLANAYWNGSKESYEAIRWVEQTAQAALVRDLFGNPFRPVSFRPAWRTSSGRAALALARRIYEKRRFQDLPRLAGLLEQAGCSEAEILAHCRHPGEHVRGCWVIDLVLKRG